MKKALTFLVFGLFLFGCSEDELAHAPSLIGTWIFSSHVSSECINPGDNYTEFCSGASCFEVVISANTILNDNGGIYVSYTTNGNKLTTTALGGLQIEFTYSVSETTLTLTSKGGSFSDYLADGGCKNVETYTRKG